MHARGAVRGSLWFGGRGSSPILAVLRLLSTGNLSEKPPMGKHMEMIPCQIPR
jgi:hypothetical protein